jgi:hypothetical protein
MLYESRSKKRERERERMNRKSTARERRLQSWKRLLLAWHEKLT